MGNVMEQHGPKTPSMDDEMAGRSLSDYHMRLYRAFHAQKNCLRPFAASLGLGSGQPKLLSYIAVHGSCTQRELAEYFEIDPSAVCRMLDSLEKDGFIACLPASDRRTKVIELTDRGREAIVAWDERCAAAESAMSYFTNDVDTISEALNNSFANLVQALMQAVGTLVLLFVLDWRLTLVTIAFDILIMFYVRFSSTRSKRYFSLQQETLGTLDGYVEEMVAGQKVVKVFNREPRNLADFRELNESLRVAGTTAQTYASTMVPVTVCLTYANYAIVAVVGAILAIGGQTDVGSLASYLVFVRQAAMPFNQITQLGTFLLTALAGAERVFDAMDGSLCRFCLACTIV